MPGVWPGQAKRRRRPGPHFGFPSRAKTSTAVSRCRSGQAKSSVPLRLVRDSHRLARCQKGGQSLKQASLCSVSKRHSVLNTEVLLAPSHAIRRNRHNSIFRIPWHGDAFHCRRFWLSRRAPSSLPFLLLKPPALLHPFTHSFIFSYPPRTRVAQRTEAGRKQKERQAKGTRKQKGRKESWH